MASVQRRKIRRRAERQAAAKYAAQQARLDQKAAAAQDAYNETVGAARGGARMARDALQAQLASLEQTGLHGLALQQARAELLGQIEDTHGSVKWQKASAKADLADELQSIDDARFNLEVSEANAADSLFRSKVTRKKALVKKQRQRERARVQAGKDYQAEVDKALAEIRHGIEQETPGAAGIQASREYLASNADARRASVDELVSSQGISERAAKEAIRRFIKRHSNPDKVAAQLALGAIRSVFENEDDK